MARRLDLARADSFCPTPEDQLLDIVLKNQDGDLDDFLERKDGDERARLFKHSYGHPHYKPILYVAVERQREDAVEVLLKHGADPLYAQASDKYKQAVHYAAMAGNSKIFKRILQVISADDANVASDGETPLIMIAKGKCDGDAVSCVNLLVEKGVDVNKTDINGRTASYWAAKKKHKEIFYKLLQEGAVCDDAIKSLIRKNSWPDSELSETPPESQDFFDLLKRGDEEGFLKQKNIDTNSSRPEHTLLQLACQKNLPDAVRYLLENGADPNGVSKMNPNKPIVLAAREGHHRIFSLLLKKSCQIPDDVILELSKRLNNKKFPGVDHEECFSSVLDGDVKFDCNCTDQWHNTPLHHASKYGTPDHTGKLLEKGSSLACKNDFSQLAVENIDSDTLRKHFDSCVAFDEKTDASEESTITFDYTSLVLPTSKSDGVDETNVEDDGEGLIERRPDKETDVILYIARQKELRHLLLHPLIASFVFLKWRLVSGIFYANLMFYCGFCFSLVMYITLQLNGGSEDAILTFYAFLVAFYVGLVLREAFQFLVTPATYWRSFENLTEVTLVVITGFILTQRALDDNRSKQLVAAVTVLAAFELVLLFGQHPLLSTYVVMLKTVSYNFLKFFSWYFVLIVAFAFSFFILFKDTDAASSATNETAGKNETDFFDDPGDAILKTIIMLTGEFDAGDIKFETYPLTSRIIFLVFVLTISIILLNLLNGLAVSDTQMIKNDAEIVGLVQLVQHVAYVESLLSGGLLPTVILAFLRKCCCCACADDTKANYLRKRLLKGVLLFPHCDDTKKVTVNAYTHHARRANAKKNKPKIHLDKKNLKNTLNWWRSKKRSPDLETLVKDNKMALDKIVGDMATLRERQNLLLARLEVLCNSVNNNSDRLLLLAGWFPEY